MNNENKISLFSGKLQISERLALISTIVGFLIILGLIILIANFFLPKLKIKIEIIGPEKVKSGEEVTYIVKIKNIGNVILENPELTFQHPESSLPKKSLVEVEKLGDFLYPKEEKKFEFKTQIFGKEGERKEIKAWLNFSKKGKKVVLREVRTFYVTVSEIPIDLILDLASKIPIYPKRESEFSFRIKYLSLLDSPLSNLKLKILFPPNFRLTKSYPYQTKESEWEIPTLAKGEGREIEFWGYFPAGTTINQELEFKVQLFARLHEKDFFLKEVSSRALTFEPTFFFTQKINGKENYIASAGERLHYQILFKNIQDKPLRDLVLTVTLEGKIFDLFTIETPTGQFKPGDNSITWTGEKISTLRYLTPGEEGEVEFWVNLKSDYKPENVSQTNALIKCRVLLAGFEKEFRNKVNSKLIISQEGYYKDKYGFFENQGPIPPKVNKTTTYTIVWKIENYYNWVKDVKVKAVFPPQVQIKSNLVGVGELKIAKETGRGSIYPGIPVDFKFEKPLYYGITDEDVRYLQIILREEVPHIYKPQTGISGFFGKITFEAVKGFQKKYQNDILFPQNLKQPTGYVDDLTRAKLNELLAQGQVTGKTEVTWNIEKVEAGIGVLKDPLIAAFQIAFTPELKQKGKVGTLVEEVTISGTDLWTNQPLLSKDQGINTTLPDDPRMGEGTIQ